MNEPSARSGDIVLGDSFKLSEFVRSGTASRLGIDNTPSAEIVERLRTLVRHVLQPVRDRFGPVIVTSGYRSTELNAVIGGAAKSQHVRGEAADFVIPGVPLIDIARWVAENCPFDQVILEEPPTGWVHVSYTDVLRREVLTKVAGQRGYRSGLVV